MKLQCIPCIYRLKAKTLVCFIPFLCHPSPFVPTELCYLGCKVVTASTPNMRCQNSFSQMLWKIDVYLIMSVCRNSISKLCHKCPSWLFLCFLYLCNFMDLGFAFIAAGQITENHCFTLLGR